MQNYIKKKKIDIEIDKCGLNTFFSVRLLPSMVNVY